METEKTGGGLQRFQSSGESNGSTWFWFKLSVFCHAGESISQKVMYNTLLITFWQPGSPRSAFHSPRPSPAISTFYPSGAETQVSTATIQSGFLSPEAIAKAIGNPSITPLTYLVGQKICLDCGLSRTGFWQPCITQTEIVSFIVFRQHMRQSPGNVM